MKYLVERVSLIVVNGGGHLRTRAYDTKDETEDLAAYREEVKRRYCVDRVLLNYQEAERNAGQMMTNREIDYENEF